MAGVKNRILELLGSDSLNGMDYVETRRDEPKRLFVHFFNHVEVHEPDLAVTITGGDLVPQVELEPVAAGDWHLDAQGRQVLTLRVPDRGDFSAYTLTIENAPRLDPYFKAVQFSFFAFCPSLIDCRLSDEYCPEGEAARPRIDYLAKDYESFRLALSEFSDERYPEWRERSEADFGVVMLELLSAVADDLSYLQDRIHQEGTLANAKERRSLLRLARLVDYEPRPLTSARTILQCRVDTHSLPAGVRVSARTPEGGDVVFEIGGGLNDESQYPVSPAWNELEPYWWDDDDRCLEPHATSMFVKGIGHGLLPGLDLLMDTQAEASADPPLRQVVRLTAAEEMSDPLYSQGVTLIRWRKEDALVRHHDLTRTLLKGNLLPATQGERQVESFAIGQAPPQAPGAPVATERLDKNSGAAKAYWQYLHSLAFHPLAYLEDEASGEIKPEIMLTAKSEPDQPWRWVRSILNAGPYEKAFTLEPGAWRAIADTHMGVARDYDGSDGETIRFGDGSFGELPNQGDFFEVRYRTSQGQAGNLPADTINDVDPAWLGILLQVNNPFAAYGGADQESLQKVKQRAPEAFRVKTLRAVRPEDYDLAVQSLPWVQRSGTVFRWTGSWPTIFTTADPLDSDEIQPEQHRELIDLLNRRRLAGYECYAPQPAYISFDLIITVCALTNAFQGDVLAGLQRRLSPRRGPDGVPGFFHYDNYSLGTPFRRSKLEAAIHDVPGVAGVISIKYRRRGCFNQFRELPEQVRFAPGQIFRLDNNPSRPERGSFRLTVKGGK